MVPGSRARSVTLHDGCCSGPWLCSLASQFGGATMQPSDGSARPSRIFFTDYSDDPVRRQLQRAESRLCSAPSSRTPPSPPRHARPLAAALPRREPRPLCARRGTDTTSGAPFATACAVGAGVGAVGAFGGHAFLPHDLQRLRALWRRRAGKPDQVPRRAVQLGLEVAGGSTRGDVVSSQYQLLENHQILLFFHAVV